MKNKKIFKTLSALCAALVLMMGLSVTAFAQGTEELPAEDATNDSNVVVEETEDSPALTPDGNAALVDDFGDNKQLITVTTKAGNYFYILIDRANEDKETAVHFLNQVDEADLMALMEDGQTTQEQPATCTCTEKCVAGAVNTACPVCATNMSACTGKEPEPETPEETPEPEEPAQKPAGLNPAILLAVLALMGGGGAFAYFKLVKNKPKTKAREQIVDPGQIVREGILAQIRADAQIFRHGQVFKHAAALRHERDAARNDLVGRFSGQFRAVKQNFARLGPDQPGNGFQCGRFACTVRADEGHNFALLDLQVDALDGLDAAVRHDQIFDLQNITHPRPPPDMRR